MRACCESLQNHLMAAYAMLTDVVNVCPEKYLYGTTEADAIWKRILHTLESVDYWINRKEKYRFEKCFKNFSAEIDEKNENTPPPEKIKEYLDVLKDDILMFCNELDDGKLLQKNRDHHQVKNMDIILTQLRHIQTNVGYCNEVLRQGGSVGVSWVESGL